MFDLVIFDCDGVLVDSELLAAQAESRTFAECGIDLSPEQVLTAMVGLSEQGMAEWARATYGRPLPDDFFDRYRSRREALFTAELQAIPGVALAIKALGQPVCVASNSPLYRVEHSLTVTDLRGLFGDNVFSADHVPHPKPAPDLFQHAARNMGADPSRCLVIEDSKTGAIAARAAGMTCFGYLGGSHIGDGHDQVLRDHGAHTTFAHMADLPAMVAAGRPKAARAIA